jgi:hypothetical protein
MSISRLRYKMLLLNSTAIARIEYNPTTHTLKIWFRESGGPYDYYGVPQSVYEGLIRAPSVGAYFNAYIRDHYSSNR